MKQLSLRELRKQADYSQKDLAQLCGVTPQTYLKWEKDPSVIPHVLYEQIIHLLQVAIQIRKGMSKMNYLGKVHVRFVSPDELPEDDYTVDVPDDLTEDFHPSKPVTPAQQLAYEMEGIEPYPGYEDEVNEWEKRWEKVNRAQLEKDGAPVLELDPVHPDPEFDESTGEPIVYDENHAVVDPDSGDATLYVNEADLTDDELAKDEGKE